MYSFQREQDEYIEREREWQRRKRWPTVYAIRDGIGAVIRAAGLIVISALCLLFLGLVPLGKAVWHSLNAWGYIYHDELVNVDGAETGEWQFGEYKYCTTKNCPDVLGPGNLSCGLPISVGPSFVVRFWGPTYDETKPHYGDAADSKEPALFRWLCRKNENGDPSITCHQTSVKQSSP
jgi:hypothetical protein